MEAEVYNNIKSVIENKKRIKKLLNFIVLIKSTTTDWGKKKEKNPKENAKQVKRIINIFLHSLLSASLRSLGVTVRFTPLGCLPTLLWSLDLLWG